MLRLRFLENQDLWRLIAQGEELRRKRRAICNEMKKVASDAGLGVAEVRVWVQTATVHIARSKRLLRLSSEV